jgi:polysaccharide pyruvyl transferase WcaK-like protein
VGDEAVAQMLVRCTQDLGASKVGVVVYAPDDDWGLRSAVPAVDLVLVPSWPFDRGCWCVPSVLAMLRDFDDVLVAGNDCIDGGYSDEGTCALLDLARFADHYGCRVTFVNCSYNAEPTPTVVRELQRLPDRISFWFRDVLSAASFTRSTGRTAHLGGEIGFLTQPRLVTNGAAFDWVRRQKGAGNKVIGLIPNPMVGTGDPLGSPHRSPAPYLEVLERLLHLDGERVHVIVIPNDARPGVGDVELTTAIAAGLPAAMRERVFFVPHPLHASVLAELFRHVDLVVGARFHALVMALVAGTPIVALEYQDKMRGVLRACGLEEFWIPCEDGLSPTTILARVEVALGRSDELRTTIGAAVPTLRRRAREMVQNALAGGG